MFKRTVTFVGLLLALSAPAALADSGNLKQNVDRLHDRIQKVTAEFTRRCATGKADGDKCKAAAQKLVVRLQTLSGRIDDRIAKIKEHCGAGTSVQPAPKACRHADEVVEKLRAVQGDLKELAAKLQAWLGSGSSTGGDVAGLESLDQLTADLAAAQAAAGN